VGRRIGTMAVSKPIPNDKRIELEKQYGHWAVETAIGVCPRNDVRCIEREAKRLHDSRDKRR
jgi:hypothetical protein